MLKKLKVHIVIKNHRNSLLFGYYKLSFRCLEVNLFLHCFDLKDLNPNKRFEPLRKDLLFTWRNVANVGEIVSFRPPRHLFLHFIFLASFCNYCSVANK